MPGLQEAHNGYIELYLNLGWIGVTLLALIIVTGYRHVLRALRRDPSRGGLGFAFFVATVVYSLSEAGFRMMTPVWIAFLLATTTLPEAAIPEGSPALGIECDDSFAAPQPQLEHVPGIGFPKEAI
jgi:O-antigen ligase